MYVFTLIFLRIRKPVSLDDTDGEKNRLTLHLAALRLNSYEWARNTNLRHDPDFYTSLIRIADKANFILLKVFLPISFN